MLIDINIHAIDPPDPDLVYANYLETRRRAGVTPVSREQAFGLIQEWTGVLSGRPEPTTHKRAVLIGVVITERVVVAAVHTANAVNVSDPRESPCVRLPLDHFTSFR